MKNFWMRTSPPTPFAKYGHTFKGQNHKTALRRRFGVKPGFSFDWFDTERPEEIAIRVIPDRKELSRRLKGAGKSYSPLRDSVRELLQERSEEMV